MAPELIAACGVQEGEKGVGVERIAFLIQYLDKYLWVVCGVRPFHVLGRTVS